MGDVDIEMIVWCLENGVSFNNIAEIIDLCTEKVPEAHIGNIRVDSISGNNNEKSNEKSLNKIYVQEKEPSKDSITENLKTRGFTK